MVHAFTPVIVLFVAASTVLAFPQGGYSVVDNIDSTAAKRAVNDQKAYLDAHNAERASHGAKALAWDGDLASSAQAWADGCQFKHSQSGQNLVAGGEHISIQEAIGLWNDERKDYNPASPDYSHWTQVVWKGTKKLGCASAICPPGSIFSRTYGKSRYIVCHYGPPGNVIGRFGENVQP